MNQKRRHAQVFVQSSKLVTSAVVKPIFKLDSFIQEKSTRYLSRHSSTLVAFSNHLLSFSAMLPATWYNSSSFSTRPVPVRNAARPWSPSSAARCQRASPSCLSWSQSSWPPYHQGSNEWEKHNMKKLDRSQKKFQKLVKQTCEEKITNDPKCWRFFGNSWCNTSVQSVKVNHEWCCCNRKETRQKWSTKKGPAQGLSTRGKYDHKFWS